MNNKIDQGIKLDFDDVLIKPKKSYINSRKDVNLEQTFVFKNIYNETKLSWTGIPIMSSNMDTVGTFEMYRELSKYKMITCLHKHYNIKDFPLDLDSNYYAISTGILEKDYIKLQALIKHLNPYFVCIDVANGYINDFSNFVKKVSENYPKIVLICGNVVSPDLTHELFNNGADIIKCGVGSGSVCKTRTQTGIGMPQLSCILECSIKPEFKYIMSDGGCVHPCDISKALGAGSNFVMLGSILAGHHESGGTLITEENGKQYKTFYGMSSSIAMNKYANGVSPHRSSEGKLVKIPFKGFVRDTIQDILGGIRSTCTYTNTKNIEDLEKNTTFIRVNNQINNSLNQYNI